MPKFPFRGPGSKPPAEHADAAYEVGYGRPPKGHQFQPGQSGNPRGPRKGLKNVAEMFKQALLQRVPIIEDGQRRSITKAELIVQQLTNQAAKGDNRAITQMLAILTAITGPLQPQIEGSSSEADAIVMQSIIEQMHQELGADPKNSGLDQDPSTAIQNGDRGLDRPGGACGYQSASRLAVDARVFWPGFIRHRAARVDVIRLSSLWGRVHQPFAPHQCANRVGHVAAASKICQVNCNTSESQGIHIASEIYLTLSLTLPIVQIAFLSNLKTSSQKLTAIGRKARQFHHLVKFIPTSTGARHGLGYTRPLRRIS